MSRTGLCLLLVTSAASAFAAPPAGTVEQRLERLERRVDRVTELTLQLDALRRENRELRGRAEELQHAMEALERKQRDLYLDMDQRLSRLQGGAPAGAPPAAPTPTPVGDAAGVGETATAPAGDPQREEAAYQAAYDLLRPEQRRYGEAIEAFRAFLANYPNGKFADNAQYWLAEASYVTQDNATALVEFRNLVERFPASSKVPGALLKIGYIQHAGGQVDAARGTLGEVVERYPGTPAADMARQRLERIAREAR